jgi:hypothetical protein
MVLNVMTPSQREEFEKTTSASSRSAAGRGPLPRLLLLPAQSGRHGAAPHRDQDPDVEELSLPPIIKTLA